MQQAFAYSVQTTFSTIQLVRNALQRWSAVVLKGLKLTSSLIDCEAAAKIDLMLSRSAMRGSLAESSLKYSCWCNSTLPPNEALVDSLFKDSATHAPPKHSLALAGELYERHSNPTATTGISPAGLDSILTDWQRLTRHWLVQTASYQTSDELFGKRTIPSE